MPAGNCFRCSRGSSDLRLTDDCHMLHRHSALRRVAKNAVEILSCPLAQSHQKDMCLHANLSSLCRSTCEVNYKVHRGFQWRRTRRERLGGHAQMERILCIHHASIGLIIAALKTRGRRDLMTLPEGES